MARDLIRGCPLLLHPTHSPLKYAPREIRTPDLRFRRPTLYPAELWAQAANSSRSKQATTCGQKEGPNLARGTRPVSHCIRELHTRVELRRSTPPGPLPSHAGHESRQTVNGHSALDRSGRLHDRDKWTEGGRFELPRRGLPACRFSRPVHSTALPPLQGDVERLLDPLGPRDIESTQSRYTAMSPVSTIRLVKRARVPVRVLSGIGSWLSQEERAARFASYTACRWACLISF